MQTQLESIKNEIQKAAPALTDDVLELFYKYICAKQNNYQSFVNELKNNGNLDASISDLTIHIEHQK